MTLLGLAYFYPYCGFGSIPAKSNLRSLGWNIPYQSLQSGETVIIEWVGIVSSPDQREELRRALSALVGPTSVEPGCIGCSLYTEAARPNKFCLETRWRSETELVKHLRSEQYRNVLVLIELAKEPPVVEFHDVSKTRGLELVSAIRQDTV